MKSRRHALSSGLPHTNSIQSSFNTKTRVTIGFQEAARQEPNRRKHAVKLVEDVIEQICEEISGAFVRRMCQILYYLFSNTLPNSRSQLHGRKKQHTETEQKIIHRVIHEEWPIIRRLLRMSKLIQRHSWKPCLRNQSCWNFVHTISRIKILVPFAHLRLYRYIDNFDLWSPRSLKCKDPLIALNKKIDLFDLWCDDH